MAAESERFVGNYWVRSAHGFDFTISRIPSRARLPVADQLVLAILRGDSVAARAIISNAPQALWLNQLAEYFGAEQLVGLIYSRIHDLGLVPLLEPLTTGSNVPLLSHLRQLAASAQQTYEQRNEQFFELLTIFESVDPPVVFLKGVVLSRTLYEQPQYRLSTDFDVLVHECAAGDVVRKLEQARFNPIWNHPGHCHQFGVGPVGTLADLTTRPSPQLEPFHNLTFEKKNWPFIELKSTILENGLRMRQEERFWNDCRQFQWQGHSYWAPDPIDHLMLVLVHFRKHIFSGWPWLYDVHLLIEQVNIIPGAWQDFTTRCLEEGIAPGAWAALDVARDRLESPVPDSVMNALRPDSGTLAKLFTFSTEPAFLWNLIGLPALCMGTAFGGDRPRKLKVLRDCLLPGRTFLQNYYQGGAEAQWWQIPFLLCLHWLVLLLPGSITRRTFGRLLWRSSNSYPAHAVEAAVKTD